MLIARDYMFSTPKIKKSLPSIYIIYFHLVWAIQIKTDKKIKSVKYTNKHKAEAGYEYIISSMQGYVFLKSISERKI